MRRHFPPEKVKLLGQIKIAVSPKTNINFSANPLVLLIGGKLNNWHSIRMNPLIVSSGRLINIHVINTNA